MWADHPDRFLQVNPMWAGHPDGSRVACDEEGDGDGYKRDGEEGDG